MPRHRPLHRRSVSDTIASRIGGVLGADSDNGIEGSSAHWRTINSNARLRLATQASELNDGEVRGIIATPLDSDMATHMTSRKRILNLIHDEVDDFTDDFRQMLGLGISQDSRTGLADPRVSNQLQARSDSIASQIDEGDAVDIHQAGMAQMYNLRSTSRASADASCCRRALSCIMSIINCGAHSESVSSDYNSFGSPTRWLVDFFYWIFRKDWLTVFALAVVAYYVIVFFFTGLIVAACNMDKYCVRVGGMPLGELKNRSIAMDAFSLSWNTFSTVGYGSTWPALSTENEDSECVFVVFVTSLEAFIGILYAGFISAIIFAKVKRITQRAHVKFSDPITIRFGDKGAGEAGDYDYDDNEPQDQTSDDLKNSNPMERFKKLAKKSHKPSPFPVLEFRIANEKHSMPGGEILSSKVNAVVLMESTRNEDRVCDDLAKHIVQDRDKRRPDAPPHARLRKKLSGRIDGTDHSRATTGTMSSAGDTDTQSSGASGRSLDAATYLQILSNRALGVNQKQKIDEEDEVEDSGRIVPRMVFTKMKLETSEHPMFRRIWRFKHIIDQDSPLLTAEAERAIAENGGRWPAEWNNHRDVRRAITFNQMVVSFTGISNISGDSVYAQKVYDFIDIAFGYQFVNALYQGRRDRVLKVDMSVINDVVEQPGGGGEPLLRK